MSQTEKQLFLYSDQDSPANREMDLCLRDRLPTFDRRIAYLSSSPDNTRSFYNAKKTYYQQYDISLGEYFDENSFASAQARDQLARYPAIHLSGGSTYHFRQWLFDEGLDELLVKFADTGGILVGVSAGALLLTPDIVTTQLCGESEPDSDSESSGLNVVNFHLWPHFEPGIVLCPSQKLIQSVARPLYQLPDGTGIVSNGIDVEIYGKVYQS